MKNKNERKRMIEKKVNEQKKKQRESEMNELGLVYRERAMRSPLYKTNSFHCSFRVLFSFSFFSFLLILRCWWNMHFGAFQWSGLYACSVYACQFSAKMKFKIEWKQWKHYHLICILSIQQICFQLDPFSSRSKQLAPHTHTHTHIYTT